MASCRRSHVNHPTISTPTIATQTVRDGRRPLRRGIDIAISGGFSHDQRPNFFHPMTSTKFITFGIGCVLLLPFIWCFVLMVFPTNPSPEEAAQLASMEKLQKQAEDQLRASNSSSGEGIFFGVTSVTTYEAVTLHPKLAGVWLLASRKWVGTIGLIASLALLACLLISSFFPVIVSSFSIEHQSAASPSIQNSSLEQASDWTNHAEPKER